MLVTRAMAQALIRTITHPRHGRHRIEGGKIKFLDRTTGKYRAVVMRDRAISVLEAD